MRIMADRKMGEGKRLTVDVIIPVYKPDKKFSRLLKMLSLQTYPIGKIIVMNFWSSQCNPCKMEMPDMQKAYEAYQGEVEFVMINVLDAMYDTKETANAYIAENNYTFPVYFDTQFNAIQTYGVNSFPTTYVIDQEGNLYGRAIGVLSYEALTDALDDLLA